MQRRLGLACSAEKRQVLSRAQDRFNAAEHRGADGAQLIVECQYYDDADLIRWVVGRDFRLFTPSSEMSLFQLRRQWEGRVDGQEPPLYIRRFAASPIVFAMSKPTYETLTRTTGPIGWSTLVNSDRLLRLVHAHGSTTDGLTVLAAAWVWAGGGQLPAEEQETGARATIRSLEERIVEYAPDDRAALQRGRTIGADVVVAQERAVLEAYADDLASEVLVVYPVDGTVWADQIVAVIASGDDSDEQLVCELLAEDLQSPDLAGDLMTHGLHMLGSGLGTQADSTALLSAHRAGRGGLVSIVNPGKPPMVLPGYANVRIIADSWTGVARDADVCLVIDTSGSMSGEKLSGACAAVRSFLQRPQSAATNLGLVTFDDGAVVRCRCQPADLAALVIDKATASVTAGGGTSLFDAVMRACTELERLPNVGHLRAVITLTDGQDNGSSHQLTEAQHELSRVGAAFYAIAYGADADMGPLDALAGPKGHVVPASVGDIERVFDALSAHV